MSTNPSYVNKALFGLSLIAASLLMLFVSSPARAVDFTVTNTNNYGEGSLREAVTVANRTDGANTIVFSPALASGTITLTTDQLTITDPDGVTIDGGSDITVRGSTSNLGNIRVFRVMAGGKLDLKNLTVNGGVAGSAGGGGVLNELASQLTVSNCTFSGNSAPLSSGGAIWNGVRGVVTVTNSTFSGNSASSTGGGISNNGGTLSVTNSTFSGNSAPQGGGGIYNNGTATLTDSTFSGNSASSTGTGGGIYNLGPLTLTNSTLSGNSAQQGGGIYNSGTVTLTNSPISGNSAQQGGGIYNGRTVTLTNSTLSGNKVAGAAGSTSKGGGIFNNGTGTLTASGSTFSGNSAGGPGGGVGGGVYSLGESTGATGANVTVANSTFWGNTATDSGGSGAAGGTGGGIFSGSKANLTATNSTFAANSATIHGAAIESGPDSTFQTILKNTIVADSTKVSNCDGSITDGGHNIDDGSSCGLSALTSKSNTDPKLDALGSYGGPTRTIALQDDSPAIDAIPDTNGSTAGCGDAGITTDQRCVTRPQDGDANGTASCDIGAFELPEPPPGQRFATNEDTPKTITLTATDAAGNSLTFAITQLPSHGTLGSIGAVTCTGTAPKTCSANVTYTPAPNYYGFDSFKFRTNDGTVNSASAPVSLTVRSVNDAPSFQLGANRDQKVNEDAVAQSVSNFVSSFSTGPADESGQEVDYLVTNTNDSLFSARPAISSSGTLTYTLAANAFGSADVTVRLTDNGGTANGGNDTSDERTFNIAVNAVNDAPSFTKGADQTVDEDAPAQSIANWAANISVGPSNESTQTVSFVVTDNSNPNLFSAKPAVSSNGTLTYTPAANANGEATVSVKITDNGGIANGGVNESTAQSFTIAVNAVNDAPKVSNSQGSQNVQYSDPIAAVTITATDEDTAGSSLTASSEFKKDSGSFGNGLPSGLSLELASTSANDRTWTLSGTANVAPGTYVVRVTVSDNDNTDVKTGFTDITIVVAKEDATVGFNGALFYAVPSGSANVTLSAVVTDAADGNRGDIRNATVTFAKMDGTPYLNCANRPVTLLTPGDTTTGVATCNVSLAYSSTGSLQYDVRMIVNGYYTRDNTADNAVVTVSQAVNGMITGGGFLVNQNSFGQYAGGVGQKTNFGFNVKYNKAKTSLQGNINTIVRSSDGKVYQIKGNSMTSLATNLQVATAKKATFVGKANLTDITNPLNPVAVGGGHSLKVTMTDAGEPGKNDTIGIQLTRTDGSLLFSSKWSGTNTVEQLLGGGNLVVR